VSIEPGILYVVATPIGHLEDISYRAVAILRQVDLVAAEDTRDSAKLFKRYCVNTPCTSLHEHNEEKQAERLLRRLIAGDSVALISDAGTPLISDPGFRLVLAAHRAGVRVSPIPGACAAIAALSVAGLPSDHFVFEGFLPTKAEARRRRLRTCASEPRTLIFYEASHRIVRSLEDMRDCLGAARQAVVARELTKAFETVHGASLEKLCEWVLEDGNRQRGEFVVLVQGFSQAPDQESESEIRRILSLLLADLPLNTAVRLAAQITGQSKNKIYRIALNVIQF
jgi:16S rRNA (cytidine1402-2'-O)-methyltransferase